MTSPLSPLLAFLSQQPRHRIILFLPVVLLSYFVIQRIRQYRRLRHFPGPFSTGISWIWHTRAVLSGKCHLYYGDATEKYGPIARIAPNHLITSSPELWAHINAVRSPYKRAEWYYHTARFVPGVDNVFTECDNEKHDARRRRMAAGYAGKENPSLEPTINAQIQQLLHLIHTQHASPNPSTPKPPMDLATKIQYLTLDVISSIGLGTPFGCLSTNSDKNSYLAAMELGLRIGNIAWGLGTSFLRDVPILGKALSPSEKDVAGFGRMMAEARKFIEDREGKSKGKQSDMMASFVRHGVQGEDIFHEIMETMLAGSDTTAAAIRILMLFLMSHPRVYAKLQKEIDTAVKEGVAPASPEIISDAAARKLPYLAAVVREGMRVHPPVSNIFSRVVPKEGDVVTVDGKEFALPGGTMIGSSAWSMHRNNKSIYGEDAAVFRPERWLVGDEGDAEEKEKLARMHRTSDMIFGYGRWRCLGNTVALIEIHKIVFELLRGFDWALTNPQKPWTITNISGLFAIGDMWVNVTEREVV